MTEIHNCLGRPDVSPLSELIKSKSKEIDNHDIEKHQLYVFSYKLKFQRCIITAYAGLAHRGCLSNLLQKTKTYV